MLREIRGTFRALVTIDYVVNDCDGWDEAPEDLQEEIGAQYASAIEFLANENLFGKCSVKVLECKLENEEV